MAQKGPAKPRKKKEEPEKPQNAERWLLTYSDMITLLMVLFVVLYAESKVEVTKFNALAESLSSAFNMPGVQAQRRPGRPFPLADRRRPHPASRAPASRPSVSPKRDPFQEKARSTLATEIRTGSIRMITEARGIVLALAGDTFFKVGSADLEEGVHRHAVQGGRALAGPAQSRSRWRATPTTPRWRAATPWAPTSCSRRRGPYP